MNVTWMKEVRSCFRMDWFFFRDCAFGYDIWMLRFMPGKTGKVLMYPHSDPAAANPSDPVIRRT